MAKLLRFGVRGKILDILISIYKIVKSKVHAREPQYSTVAAIPWWLQSTSAEVGIVLFSEIL